MLHTRSRWNWLMLCWAILFLLLFVPAFLLRARAGLVGESTPHYLPLVFRRWPPPSATPLPARLLISEVLYDPNGSEPDGEWIEIYNAGGSPLVLNGYKLGDAAHPGDREGMLCFPDGATIGPGQVLVVANQATHFASEYGFTPDYEMEETDPDVPGMAKYTAWTGWSVLLTNSGDEVVILDPADRRVDTVSWGSSTEAFNPSVKPVADGLSIERWPASLDTDTAHDWVGQNTPAPGRVRSSPPTPTASLTPNITPTLLASLTPGPSSTATPSGPVVLLVSEVLYDPTGAEPDQEWLELFNAGAYAINLADYKIGDEETPGGGEGMYRFPPQAALAPGQVLLIANKASAFFAVYGFWPDYELRESDGDVPNLLKYSSWASGSIELVNSGDEVLILDAADRVVEALSWGNSTFAFDPSVRTVAAGHSLERRPATQDTDTAMDWVDQGQPAPGLVDLASPGTPSAPTSTALPAITATQIRTVTPTPTTTSTRTGTATQTTSPIQTHPPTATATPIPSMTTIPSRTPTRTATPTPPATSSSTATPTKTLTPAPTRTAAITASHTQTGTATPTPAHTKTFTPTLTATTTATVSQTPTFTAVPTHTPTLNPSVTPTATPTSTSTATPSGPAFLLVSEFLYDPTGTEPDQEWIEIYNAGSWSVALDNYKIGDEETRGGSEGMYQFPQGADLAPGQGLVVANKASAFYTLFGFWPAYELRESDEAIPNLAKYTAWSTGSLELSNSGDEILLLGPADDLVDTVSWGSSTFAFSPSVPGVAAGHSLERRPAGQDTDSASDWVDQPVPAPGQFSQSAFTPTPAFTGTPVSSGTPTLTPTPTPLGTTTITMTPTATITPSPSHHPLISEVLYDPAGGTEPDNEWIEIYNPGAGTIDLSHYKIGDEETQGGGEGMLQFPPATSLVSGQFIVIANKATAFMTTYGVNPDYEMLESDPAVPNLARYSAWGAGSVGLSNTGDEVLLLDPNDALVDVVAYGNSSYPGFQPTVPDVAEAHSIERRPVNADTGTAADWFDQASPTPGGGGQTARFFFTGPAQRFLIELLLIIYAVRRR